MFLSPRARYSSRTGPDALLHLEYPCVCFKRFNNYENLKAFKIAKVIRKVSPLLS
jgi:hypothetical protein